MDDTKDLAAELSSRLRDSERVLYKNAALLERVVLACVQSLRGESGLVWSECRAVLKSARIIKEWEPQILKKAKALLGIPSIGGPASSSENAVRETWKDAPVAEEASAPFGWIFGEPSAAICKVITKIVDGMEVKKYIPVCFEPVVITQIVQQKEDSSIFFELAWLVGSEWHTRIWPRDTLFSARKIVDCSAFGLPVASDNASFVVEYLRAYEHHNRQYLARTYSSSSTGWLGNDDDLGHHGFLAGNRQIGANGQQVYYTGKAAADYKTVGTLEGWREGIAIGLRWPAMRLALLASLAAPLIGVVGAPNMIVEWISDTTGGKTVALKYARSVWMSGTSKPPTWFATVNGLESHVQGLNDLPVFIDDTAEIPESKRRDVLSSAVYMLESGHTKLRSGKDLVQRDSATWRSIVLSTGEYALSDHISTGGASARVLSLYGRPTGASSSETGALLRKMMLLLGKNYGHAGPMLVKWLCDNQEKWPALETEYGSITEDFRAKLVAFAKYRSENKQEGDPSVAPATMRLSETIAMLQITNRICIEAGILDWGAWSPLEDGQVLTMIGHALDQASRMANKARIAYEHVVSLSYARNKQWIPWGDGPPKDEPSGGWLGWRRFDKATIEPAISGSDGRPVAGALLAWFPGQLKSVLEHAGFQFEATVKTWRSEGLLVASQDRMTYRAKFAGDGNVVSAYVLRATRTKWSPQNEDGTDLSKGSD